MVGAALSREFMAMNALLQKFQICFKLGYWSFVDKQIIASGSVPDFPESAMGDW